MVATVEMEQLNIELVPCFPVMQKQKEMKRTEVFKERMYVESEYGKLLGTVIRHKGKYIAFCPMEISVELFCFEDLHALENSGGELLSVFYMDNDEVIDIEVYHKFVNDQLPQDKLELVYIKKIIPFIEKKGII